MLIYAFSCLVSNTTAAMFTNGCPMSRSFETAQCFKSPHGGFRNAFLPSIVRDARGQQAEFLEVDVSQRIFVLGQHIGIGWRQWNGEIGRHTR